MTELKSDDRPAGLPNLQLRQKNTAAVLTGCAETRELEDGYALRYPDNSEWNQKLDVFCAAWAVSSPNMKLCLVPEESTGSVWLEIRGPSGTKEFVEGARYMLTSHINPKGSAAFKLRHGLRFLSSPLRVRPDFIVIGAKKCGTTALYDYMTQHPGISPALKKEIYYFNAFHGRGQYWYRSFFPTILERWRARLGGRLCLTGEATPDYLYRPECPARIKELVPQVRLIAILRNPIDRAYSFYNHNRRAGLEALSFEAAIEAEESRIEEERQSQQGLQAGPGFAFMNYSYKARGVYVDQLGPWMESFPREQILVLRTEDLYHDPETVLREAFSALDLPYHAPSKFRKINTAPYDPMPKHVRAQLEEYFEPHNQRLAEFLGTDTFW